MLSENGSDSDIVGLNISKRLTMLKVGANLHLMLFSMPSFPPLFDISGLWCLSFNSFFLCEQRQRPVVDIYAKTGTLKDIVGLNISISVDNSRPTYFYKT